MKKQTQKRGSVELAVIGTIVLVIATAFVTALVMVKNRPAFDSQEVRSSIEKSLSCRYSGGTPETYFWSGMFKECKFTAEQLKSE